MSTYTSPVPLPSLDAAPAEIHRGFYGMPMFCVAPTRDLDASRDFWIEGLGFIDLFTAPGQLTHLRRWAFQDVLLVPAEGPGAVGAVGADHPMRVSFSCVVSQIHEVAARCERLLPGSTEEPRVMPWNSLELTVVTPENTHVVMTAARPIDPKGPQAAHLRSIGIEVPDA